MLSPINPIANRVAEGRRFASRSIVLTNLSSISCFAFRRKVIPAVEGETRAESIYPGGFVLSSSEEHATEYEDLGYAMLLLNKFSGGSMHNDGDDINFGEAVFYAQIEPVNKADYGKRTEMLKNIPDWQPKKGDVLAMVISEDIIKWVEVTGVTGQTLNSQHGVEYVLNVRDKLMHLDPFKQEDDLLEPDDSP